MSDLDGLEATRRLARDPVTATIPVIAVTASAFGDIRQTARDAGCVDYLSKPVRAQSLFAMLQTHLGVQIRQRQRSRRSPTAAGWIDVERRVGDRDTAAQRGRARRRQRHSGARPRSHGWRRGEAAIGERINRLAMNFDFDGLSELADSLAT